ncbi:hypothetical protein H0H81_002452 [Sphagnurus paluster]|uniref:PHD-type domain-containing protein n=1 Tax=Sphagnurus paluster TaxID=117069 RepID=A0A9P7GLW0_9AGAR|nr:hypothetical protein H0H81_002452 [Sphagnurus paluster]
MSSRRLDISSLLCNDQTSEPVRPSTTSHGPSPSPSTSPSYPHAAQMLHAHRRASPPPIQFPSPSAHKSSFGLEALVEAATEERRRISGTSPPESDFQGPIDQRQHPHFHSQHPPFRSPDDYAQYRSPTLSPIQALRSPVQPLRSPAYSPLQHQPQPRHRGPDRHRDEPHPRLSPVDDTHYRAPYLAPTPLPRQQLDLQHQELQRQRQHHETLLLQEQQQQQQARDRHIVYPDRSAPTLASHLLRGPSMPLQIDVLPRPSTHPSSGRKSDPGQLHHIIAPVNVEPIPLVSTHPPSIPDRHSYPSKKRRYSDSPVHSISPDEKDRLHREREKMLTGDLGYGRPEPSTAAAPKPPSSGNPHGRKHLGIGELLSPARETDRIQLVHTPLPPPVEPVRETHVPVNTHTHGRRSPPGSQSGRAKAARKPEEVVQSPLKPVPQVVPEKRPSPEIEEKKVPVSPPPPPPPPVPEPTPPKPKSRHAPTPPPKPAKPTEEDAHEWFLEHFDEYNAPAASHPSPPHAPPTPPPPASLSPSRSHRSRSPVPTKQPVPEAVVSLDQELEELIADPVLPSKVEPDMDIDVDLAVTELVAETLEADDIKDADTGMDVDVEDELLSLLDDRPVARRSAASSSTPGSSSSKPPAPPRPGSNSARHASPSAMSPASVASPAPGFLTPAVRPSSTRPTSERGSMPPPASVASGRGKEKDDDKLLERAGSATAPGTKKKKDTATKSKPKAAAATSTSKSRAKPAAKAKPKTSDASLSATAAKSKAGPKKPAGSRSRSASVMPAGPDTETKAEKQEEEEESDHEDDKLYCVCKTKYDEDRCMIACDRCDDWYHTQCVNMPDLEVDLVDQFVCPPCVQKNPHLSLRTTYKARCLWGLRHPDPSSPKACHRPARGAFSKYCSEECGVKYMQSRAEAWAKKGGKQEKLWEKVKDAEKREGVVVCADDSVSMDVDGVCKDEKDKDKVARLKKGKAERDAERLHGLLESVVALREEIKKGMEGVIWREKLLELARERAEQVGECGWDRRLCFGEEELAELGAAVLESYEEGRVEEGEGEWCAEQTCTRHAGWVQIVQVESFAILMLLTISWQNVRYKDICKEREKKEDALSNLTTREREIRKRIEDILDPHGRNCNDRSAKSPLKASNTKLSNGHTKGKPNGDTTKKGKKRKAPS